MQWNLADAKNRLSEVLDRARREGPQTIRRHGDMFVVVPAEQYEELMGTRPSFRDWLLQGPRLDGVPIPPRNHVTMRDVTL